MGRIIKVPIRRGELAFSYNVSVDSTGMFTTTIPNEIAKQIQDAGIRLDCNKLSNPGHFTSDTLKGVQAKVRAIVDEFSSRELIEEKTVLQYKIKTRCTYCKNPKGGFVPNGSPEWVGSDDFKWYSGTEDLHSSNRQPFGLDLYVAPRIKRVYKYLSGREVVEYDRIEDQDVDPKTNLYWLLGIHTMTTDHWDELDEIEYTEQRALFFVDFIKYICSINEKLIDLVKPENLIKALDNPTKALPFEEK